MSNLDRFIAEGADTCAGSLIYKGRELGVLRDGDLVLNDEGRALMAKLDEVTDVVVKVPKAKAKKAEVEAGDDAALDVMLGI